MVNAGIHNWQSTKTGGILAPIETIRISPPRLREYLRRARVGARAMDQKIESRNPLPRPDLVVIHIKPLQLGPISTL